jgi:hypothetical protein
MLKLKPNLESSLTSFGLKRWEQALSTGLKTGFKLHRPTEVKSTGFGGFGHCVAFTRGLRSSTFRLKVSTFCSVR